MNLPKEIPQSHFLAYILKGSRARNLQTANSDHDYCGIFIGSLNFYFGNAKKDSYVANTYGNDVIFYELRKFINLLAAANPNCLELLWTEPKHFLHTTDIFQEIVRNRNLFVSKQIYKTFNHYALQQIHRMTSCTKPVIEEYEQLENILIAEGLNISELSPKQSVRDKIVCGKKLDTYIQRYIQMSKQYFTAGGRLGIRRKQVIKAYGYDTKNCSVLTMLMRQAIELLETGELQVTRTDRDSLLSIKDGKYSLEEIKQIIEDLFDKAAQAVVVSKLSDDVDREKIEALCVKLISDFYKIPQD